MKKLWMAAAVLALLAAACAGGEDRDSSERRPQALQAARQGQASLSEKSVSGGGLAPEPAPGGGGSVGAAPLPGIGPSVIKTADMKVQVGAGAFRDSLQEATGIAGTYGGFVLSSTVEGERARRGSIVIRVPSDRFEDALGDARDLGKVKRETVSGEDVSQEFVDLEARLRNLEAQEAVLLRLMDRARTVGDTIRVQRELTDAQLQIERIRGRLRFLRDQTSFGTIELRLVEAGVPAAHQPGTLERAWQRVGDTLLAITSGLIVALGVVGPFALVGLAVWLGARRLRRRTVPEPGR